MTTGKLILLSDNPKDFLGGRADVGFADAGRNGRADVGFADAGRKLVAAREIRGESQVVFWDLTRPEQPPVRFDQRGVLSGLSVSPDGRWVSASTYAGIVALYDAATMARAAVLQGMMQGAASVTFSPDSRSLAVGGAGREAVRLWHVATQQELLTLPGKGSLLELIAFTEGGNTLLLGSGQRGSWQMWRAPSWEVIHAAEAKEKAESKQP